MEMADVEKYITGSLGVPDSITCGDYNYWCPFCDTRGDTKKQGHLHVNYFKDVAICHSCGYATRNLLNIIRALYGCIPRSLLRRDIPSDVYNAIVKLFEVGSADKQQAVALPDGFRQLTRKSSNPTNQIVRRYLINRGVTDEQITDVGVGFCDSGMYDGCAVFPYYVFGELTYFTSRRVIGYGKKHFHPPDTKKQLALFNYDRARTCKIIFLVEGVLDALAFERVTPNYSGVAVGGNSLSDQQVNLLGQTDADEIVSCFDADMANIIEKIAYQLADRIPQKVSMLKMPIEDDDPAAVSTKRLTQLIQKRESVGFEEKVLREMSSF